MRRWLNIILAVGVGSALLGCETAPVSVGGVPNPKQIQSIVSLSPSTTEVVASLSFSNLLAGRTASCDYPPGVARTPIVASVKPDYEKIAEIHPDLLVIDTDLYSPGDIEKAKALAGQTIEFKSHNIEEFAQEIYKVGSLLGGESAASAYVDKMRTERDAALADAPATKKKAAMVMVGSGTEHLIAGTDSFYADMLRSSGTDVVGPKSTKYELLSPETFVSWNPDIVVVGFKPVDKDNDASRANALRSANAILNDPRFKSVSAVKQRHIIPINEALMARRGFRVDKFIEEVRRRVLMFENK